MWLFWHDSTSKRTASAFEARRSCCFFVVDLISAEICDMSASRSVTCCSRSCSIKDASFALASPLISFAYLLPEILCLRLLIVHLPQQIIEGNLETLSQARIARMQSRMYSVDLRRSQPEFSRPLPINLRCQLRHPSARIPKQLNLLENAVDIVSRLGDSPIGFSLRSLECGCLVLQHGLRVLELVQLVSTGPCMRCVAFAMNFSWCALSADTRSSKGRVVLGT